MSIDEIDSPKLLNNELSDSISDILKKRLTSPVYGVFLISWIAFHWNFLFTMFFVSEEKIWESTKLLKNDYLINKFCNLNDWFFYFSWVMPFLMTYLVIWHFPKWISLPAYKKEEEYKTEKRKIKIRELKKIKKEENILEEENIKKLTLETKKNKQVKKNEEIDPTKKWESDYLTFKKSRYFNNFDYIIESIYQHKGSIHFRNENDVWFSIPQETLAYCHSSDLIEITQDSISLTDKGKFFVKKFTLRNNQEEMPF